MSQSVYDTDERFVINPITREITSSSVKKVLVQHDHNSERITFEIPRIVDGQDISLCNVAQVHYLNIDAATNEQYHGLYSIEDLRVDVENPEIVIGSWLVSRNATRSVGSLFFIVRFASVDNDGSISYDWHTAIYRKLTVGSGINNTEVIAEKYADILAQWEIELKALDISVLDGRVTSAEEDITNLQKSVKANADNIASLQTTTSTNTANISTLRSDYDSDVFSQKNLLPNARTLDGTITTEAISEEYIEGIGKVNVAKAEIKSDSTESYGEALKFYRKITPLSGATYTLSFYAKGSNVNVVFYSGLYNVKTAFSSQGKQSTSVDGSMQFNLTSKWQRYYVIYTLKDTAESVSDARKSVGFNVMKSTAADTEAYIAAPQLVLGSDIKTDTDKNTAAVAQNTADIAALQAITGYTNDDILGLQVDYKNKTFTRLAGAVGKTAGADFDSFAMYGGRRRCNVANDGTINAYYGDEGYSDTGSNGQVMVYQPAFYYKVVPLKLDKNTDSGIGYHIRKANYYVSATPHTGFKLHPAFYDESGNAVDYILYSAYEGSLYSNGHIVSDDSDTEKTWDLNTDYLCSVANQKPISGLYKPLTKTNAESLAKNNGTGWHIDTIKSVSANQLLMMIELGTMNTQSAIGMSVVSITDNSSYNCSSLTGSTTNLGNSTGMAASTVNRQGSTTTTYTENGKVSVTYRGIENPWGNIWKHVNGINIWGDGTMCGGQIYVADDFNFNDSKRDGNYNAVGFTLPVSSGDYISAMGYGSKEYDWLIMPSEAKGTSALPVGDSIWSTNNLSGYRVEFVGGYWVYGARSGIFCCRCDNNSTQQRVLGARLLYIPTARI